MSLLIYPEFDPPLPVEESGTTGEFLARHSEALDDLAIAAGQKPFTAFGDTRDIPEDFDGPPEELDDILGPWTEWFDPAEGLATVRALVRHLKANPTTLRKLDGVLDELEDLARDLAVAEQEGVRFRLQMS
jgi:hypothetical protein